MGDCSLSHECMQDTANDGLFRIEMLRTMLVPCERLADGGRHGEASALLNVAEWSAHTEDSKQTAL